MTGKTTSLILALIAWLNILALEWYAVIVNDLNPHWYTAVFVSFIMAVVAGANAYEKKK